MLDADNYPDEASLKQIREYDLLEQPFSGLLQLLWENTNWADRQIFMRGKHVIHLTYSTGGWSGNENVVDALRANILFWGLCWERTDAGGHYYFRIDLRQMQGMHRRMK